MNVTSERDSVELRACVEKVSSLVKVMANTNRLRLLCQLSQGEMSVGELESILEIRQPTLSQQLAVLRENAFVNTRREGRNIYYNISNKQALTILQALSQQL